MRPPRRRRPPLRRPARPPRMRGAAVPPAVEAARRQLAEANRLLEAGQPLQAAAIFARVSEQAAQHGLPGRAAHLAARAGHAFLLGEDAERAQAHIRRAVHLSIQAGDIPGAVQMLRRALSELEEGGYSEAAQSLRAEFEERLQRHGLSLADEAPAPARRSAGLPGQCPSCMGPVRPDEVEWLDEVSVLCSYCGTVIKAEV